MTTVAEIALGRHTCKAFDPERKIPDALFAQLKTLLHFCPSAVNAQPWHFMVASSEEGRQRIARSTAQPPYSANAAKIVNASHVVVLCARTVMEEGYLKALLEQEERDGRFPTPDARLAQDKGRHYYVAKHRFDFRDTQSWMEKQVYIALGSLLLGAAALEIDATPIEGFDPVVLNDELALREKGLTSVVLVALGYRSRDDFNAHLPKSRLSVDEVFSWL